MGRLYCSEFVSFKDLFKLISSYKAHPRAKSFRSKPFPLYDDIAFIRNNAGATGKYAFDGSGFAQDSQENDEDEHDGEDGDGTTGRLSAQGRPESPRWDIEVRSPSILLVIMSLINMIPSQQDQESNSPIDPALAISTTPAVSRRTSALLDFDTPDTPTPVTKKRKHKNDNPTATALGNLADALTAFNAGPSASEVPTQSLSPVKKKQARKVVMEEAGELGLSPEQVAVAWRVFRGNSEIADEFLSFDVEGEDAEMQKAARRAWLMDEISEIMDRK